MMASRIALALALLATLATEAHPQQRTDVGGSGARNPVSINGLLPADKPRTIPTCPNNVKWKGRIQTVVIDAATAADCGPNTVGGGGSAGGGTAVAWCVCDGAGGYIPVVSTGGGGPETDPIFGAWQAANPNVDLDSTDDCTLAQSGNCPAPGASAFTDLSDTPSSYAGQGGNATRVKATADGIEFFDTATQAELDSHGGNASAHHAATVDTGPGPDCVNAGDVQTGDSSCVDPATQAELGAHSGTAGAHHTATVDTSAKTLCGDGLFLQGEDSTTCTDVETDAEATAHEGNASAHHAATVNTDASTKCTGANVLEGSGACVANAGGTDTGPIPDCPTATDVQTGDGTCLDTATQAELNTHTGLASVHHAATVDTNVKTLCGDGLFLQGNATTTCTDVETDAEAATHEGNASAHHAATVDTGPAVDCVTIGHVQIQDGSCLDPATQAELDAHAGLASVHHTAPVDSVHGRTGAVVAATSDYDAVQVDNTPAGNISATNVQAALDELDTEKKDWEVASQGTIDPSNYADDDCNDAGVTCNFAASASEGGAASSVAANTVGVSELRDSECTNGQVWKKTGGSWACGSDDTGTPTSTPRRLYVNPAGNDANDCEIGSQCLTHQRAINEAVDQGICGNAVIEAAPGVYDEKNIVFWNKDSTSSRYMEPCNFIALQGSGRQVSTIKPSSPVAGDVVLNMSGAESVKVRDYTIASTAIPVSTWGGQVRNQFKGVELTGAGDPRWVSKGRANQTNEYWDMVVYTTPGSGGGRQLRWEAQDGTGTTGVCDGGFTPFGMCINNADCGGVCAGGSLAGRPCAVTADCPSSTCTFGECEYASFDQIWVDSWLQTRATVVGLSKSRVCEGGAVEKYDGTTASVQIYGTDTCSALSCVSSGETCDTNADCQRFVKGTSTTFTSDIVHGRRIQVNSEWRTVWRNNSDTFLEVTDEFTTDATAQALDFSNNGIICNTNSDCSSGVTTGTCTEGAATDFNNKIVRSIIQAGNDSGECINSSTRLLTAWPPVACTTNTDCTPQICQNYGVRTDGIDIDLVAVTLVPDPDIGSTTFADYDLGAYGNAEIRTRLTSYDDARVDFDAGSNVAPWDTLTGTNLVTGTGAVADSGWTVNEGSAVGSRPSIFWDQSKGKFSINRDPVISPSGASRLYFEDNGAAVAHIFADNIFGTLGTLAFVMSDGVNDDGFVRVVDGDGNNMWQCKDSASTCGTLSGFALLAEDLKVSGTYPEPVWIESPASGETFRTIWRAPVAVTITEIFCEATGGTSVALDLQVDDGTPADVNGTDISCTTSGVSDSTFAGDATLAAGDKLDVVLGTVTGSVSSVSVSWSYTVD